MLLEGEGVKGVRNIMISIVAKMSLTIRISGQNKRMKKRRRNDQAKLVEARASDWGGGVNVIIIYKYILKHNIYALTFILFIYLFFYKTLFIHRFLNINILTS